MSLPIPQIRSLIRKLDGSATAMRARTGDMCISTKLYRAYPDGECWYTATYNSFHEKEDDAWRGLFRDLTDNLPAGHVVIVENASGDRKWGDSRGFGYRLDEMLHWKKIPKQEETK